MNRFATYSTAMQRELDLPYSYGQSDCFFLVLGVWDALTGGQRREQYAGRYKTLRGAQRALRKEGHKSLVSFFAADLEQVAPAMARQGDIAVLAMADDLGTVQEHCAVCTGQQFVTKRPQGKTSHGLADVKAAFRVA